MWQIFVVAALTALLGLYSTTGRSGVAAQQATATSLAKNMALYREALVSYFTANDLKNISISLATLRASGALPAWTTVDTRGDGAMWGNYRDPSGTIYVYTAILPPVNIIPDILELSNRSAMVGVYRAGDATLYSPQFGASGISSAPLAARAVPDGAPVWIAMRR